jgi:hypothetical protein
MRLTDGAEFLPDGLMRSRPEPHSLAPSSCDVLPASSQGFPQAGFALKRRGRLLLAAGVLLVAAPVHADHGALSLDVGTGPAALILPAPYAVSGGSIFAADVEVMLGLRYAITNEFELSLAGFYEPPLTYTHDGVTVPTSNGPFTGNESHSLFLFGVVGGVRYVRGSVWKLVVGLESGWSHRSYSGVQGSGQGVTIALDHFVTDNIVIQPLLGVEWAFADHWSASLLPRFTVLFGPDSTVGFSLMFSISYAWFL